MKKITSIIISSIATVGILQFAPLAPTVGAIDITEKGSADSATLKNDQGQKLDTTVTTTINTLLLILGIIAVLVIIGAGIRFATSNGDPGAIKTAKNAIIYASIGLIIAMLAFVIVNFVVSSFSGGQTK